MKKLNTHIYFLAVLLILPLMAQPIKAFADEGEVRNRSIGEFSELSVGGAFEVILTQGNSYKLKVEATEEQHEKVITELRGDRLRIRYESKRWEKNRSKITLYITYKNLEELNISGACHVKGETPLKGDHLGIEFSGASSANLELDVKSLKAKISGAGDLTLEGKADEQWVNSSGAGSYKALALESRKANVKSSGAGSIRVHVTEEFEANASGAASIRFKGNPEKFYANTTGAANVRQVN
ncbi:head GIN domain-containing protein [Xanthovirga aplysinae]|uniref:head GIN domain-containing protein n=1 Tax=Xanthovirga aplysinae TaxID=2529853 RepID=UPI0012BC5313|nr:head GIN domain-containing protein [Xanthovirga aplysinae]MTI30253.1 DUF2807 domain-containing protein [Xanthovirga aplysinae]